MVNKEAAKVLVEYSQHIAHYAAIADVPFQKETTLTRAAREHAWRLLAHLIRFAEAAKESDLYWKLMERENTPKESYRLRCLAKGEDLAFMEAKAELAKLLKDIRAIEKADPTGKKREAEAAERKRVAEENEARHKAEKKEWAKQRREARKAEKEAAAAAEASAATKKAKATARRKAVTA